MYNKLTRNKLLHIILIHIRKKNSFIKFNNSFNMGILEMSQPTKDSGNSQGADYSEGNSTQYEFLEIIGYG